MAIAGAVLEGPYVCPHRFPAPCACAKPRSHLYRRAARDLGLDLRRSFTVGDIPALFLVAVVLALLAPRRATSGDSTA